MRRNADKAQDYAQRHNVDRFYSDATQLINDKKVNAIYVATPPSSHKDYAIQAMRAGKPVYVEKPMALDHAECMEMNKVSEETGVPLFVAYYRRMLPGFVKVKQLLDENQIGKPLYFNIRYFRCASENDLKFPRPWRVVPEVSGGGYLHDMGSHQLDLIDYLLGPVQKVSSYTTNQMGYYDPPDFISAIFTGKNNLVGNAVWHFAAPQGTKEDVIDIIGEKGSISFSCFGFTNTRLTINSKNRYFANPRPSHVQQPLIETIVSQLLGEGKCPSTGITAARTSKLLDSVCQMSTQTY